MAQKNSVTQVNTRAPQKTLVEFIVNGAETKPNVAP
jgi:hypothetical protein